MAIKLITKKINPVILMKLKPPRKDFLRIPYENNTNRYFCKTWQRASHAGNKKAENKETLTDYLTKVLLTKNMHQAIKQKYNGIGYKVPLCSIPMPKVINEVNM